MISIVRVTKMAHLWVAARCQDDTSFGKLPPRWHIFRWLSQDGTSLGLNINLIALGVLCLLNTEVRLVCLFINSVLNYFCLLLCSGASVVF